MAGALAVAAPVRGRAGLAGLIERARSELGRTPAAPGHLDATLPLLDPGIRVASVRPGADRPASAGPGVGTRGVLDAPREAAGPLAAREIASRLPRRTGREADAGGLARAAGAAARAVAAGCSTSWRRSGRARRMARTMTRETFERTAMTSSRV